MLTSPESGDSETAMEETSSEMTETVTEAAEEETDEETTVSPEEAAAEENRLDTEEILNSMTLEEKVNQMFFLTPEALTNVGVVTAAGEATKNALSAHPVGGIVYFAQNIESEDQLKTMISNIKGYADEVCKVPLFIAVDEEGGTVARLGGSNVLNLPNVPNMSDIGATGDSEKAYGAGNTIGSYLNEYGFNVDFAPVADVLTNSENEVVKYRSFGSDADVVSELALQFSNALKNNGIMSCYKHFPGHGATAGDTHAGYAYTNKTYEELLDNELKPFISGIENGADFIMVGHFSLPNIVGDDTPATLSSVIINDILKEDLGYEGIIITDSLSMEALTENYSYDEIAVMAVNAGADMLLMPDNFEQAYNSILNAVNAGTISEERIDESVRKIISKKLSMD